MEQSYHRSCRECAARLWALLTGMKLYDCRCLFEVARVGILCPGIALNPAKGITFPLRESLRLPQLRWGAMPCQAMEERKHLFHHDLCYGSRPLLLIDTLSEHSKVWEVYSSKGSAGRMCLRGLASHIVKHLSIASMAGSVINHHTDYLLGFVL